MSADAASATLVPRRTRIRIADFTCFAEDRHEFLLVVRIATSDDGSTAAPKHSAEYMNASTGGVGWQPSPICPACGAPAEESGGLLNRSFVSAPAAERLQVWLSPDGQRVAIPGRRDATMPERYKAAGYRTVEAASTRDLARIEEIRGQQVGGVAENEMNFDPETRAWHDDDMSYDEDGHD